MGVPDFQMPRLVLVGETSEPVGALMRSFQSAVASRGWQSTVVTEARANNKLIDFVVRYQGAGVTGTGRPLDCRDQQRRFVLQSP